MPFNWEEYLHFSDELIQKKDSSISEEARARIAISRAYYALFCLIRDKLKINNTSKNIHQIVIEQLKNIDKESAKNLDVLRKDRNNADYETYKKFTTDMAQKNIHIAQTILQTIIS